MTQLLCLTPPSQRWHSPSLPTKLPGFPTSFPSMASTHSLPQLIVEPTASTISALKPYLSSQSLHHFFAMAFTFRTSITVLSQAIFILEEPLMSPFGDAFTVAALGKDSELIHNEFVAKLCSDSCWVRNLVLPKATPSSLVKALGDGIDWRVLCPVPEVVELEEPLVVPEFLKELESNGWVLVRVNAYETLWAGEECAIEVVERLDEGELDAIMFTSTAEVEGLLKSLKQFGLEWRTVKMRWPKLVVAAQGLVTVARAERLDIGVDLET